MAKAPAVTSKIHNPQSSLINQGALAAGRINRVAVHRAKILLARPTPGVFMAVGAGTKLDRDGSKLDRETEQNRTAPDRDNAHWPNAINSGGLGAEPHKR